MVWRMHPEWMQMPAFFAEYPALPVFRKKHLGILRIAKAYTPEILR
jgi:hypothetical protein